MSKKVWIILAICLGIPILCGAGIFAAWKLSVDFRESALEAMLLSNTLPFDAIAAKELRDYPSADAAISLIAYINMADKSSEIKEDIAQDAIASLCLLTGQDFGIDFSGTRYNFSWSPPTGDKWDEVIPLVNDWAVETFGPEVLLIIMATSDDEDDDEEEESEPEQPTEKVQP